jgi:hypothetical protein
MNELIKQAFADNPVHALNTSNGNFELVSPNKTIIVPQVWDAIAKPGWTIIIKFNFNSYIPGLPPPPIANKSGSMDDSDDESSNESTPETMVVPAERQAQQTDPSPSSTIPVKPIYDPNIRYTVSFYKVADYGNHTPSFDFERHFKKPTIFQDREPSAGKVPILQEVIKVIRSRKGLQVPRLPQPFGGQNHRGTSSKFNITSAGISLDRDDQIGEKSLLINSPLLMNVLRAVIKYSSDFPSGDSDSLKVGNFLFPYRDLYLHRENLISYKSSHPAREQHSEYENVTCDSHIDVLLSYLDNQHEIGFKQAEEKWNRDHPLVTFGSFWLLLKPGSDVYVKEFGQLNAYVVESVTGGRIGNRNTLPYRVQLWNLSMVGATLSRVMKTVIVSIFDGERDVASLPVFPVRFHRNQPGQQTLKDQLIERGKKYFGLIKAPAFREYSGEGWRQPIQTVGS